MGNSQTRAAKTAEKQRISLNQRDPHLHLRDQFNIQRTSEYNIQNDPYYNIPQQYHNGYQTATTAAQRSTTSGASGYQTATTAAQRSTTSGASGYQTATTAAQRSTTSGASGYQTQTTAAQRSTTSGASGYQTATTAAQRSTTSGASGYQTATTAAQRSTTSGASGYQTATTAAQRSTTSGASGYQTPTTAAQRSTTSGASSTTTQRSSGYASSTYIPLGTTDSDSIAEVYATDRLLHDYYAAQKATSGTSSTSNTTTPRPSTLATANSAARTAIPSTSGINRAASGTTSATSSGTNRATFNGTSSVTTGATTQRSGQDTANLQWASTSGTSSNATKKKSRWTRNSMNMSAPTCRRQQGSHLCRAGIAITLATANSAARTAIPSTSGINRAASGTTSATSSGTNRATFNGTSSVTTGATTQRSGQDTANLQWASTSGTSSNATKKKSVPRRADSDPLFNCPGCGLRFGTEIYQCDLSHSSCADCSVCVQCKKPVTRKRNYTLEDVVADRIVPCHNEDRGCDKTMLLRELEEHLMKCFCTEITCPAAKLLHCTWRGVASQLEHHFKEAHPTMNSRANQEIRVRQLNDQYNVNFVTLGEHKFLVHFKVIKDKSVAILVQVLGDNIEASKWTYEWHVYNSNEPKRKFEYADICLHASESVDDKFDNNECGVLPMHYVKNILKCDMFTYKVYLNKPSVFKSDEAPAVAAGNRKRNNRHRRNNRQPDTESTN